MIERRECRYGLLEEEVGSAPGVGPVAVEGGERPRRSSNDKEECVTEGRRSSGCAHGLARRGRMGGGYKLEMKD